MDYKQLSLKTNQDQANFVSEVLLGLGSTSITFSDTFDKAIFEPDIGEMPLWEATTLTALFDLNVNQQHVQHVLNTVCAIEDATFEVLKGRIWEDECKKDFHAQCFGKRIWICPAWEAASKLPKNAVIINLSPGLAFGTGSHQTTALCLQYLDAHPPKDLKVIDYGCGTGILGIAAAKLGAQQVTCIDHDPQAVIASRENIDNNQLNDCIQVAHSDDENVLPDADLLMANILANPLITLCQPLSDLVKSGGKIILSGILTDQLNKVLSAYDNYFFDFTTTQKEGWCRIDAIKK